MNAPDYLNPAVPRGMRRVRLPVVDATDASLEGYGRLVDDPAQVKVAITRWPAAGWRPVDEDTGDQGGTTEGTSSSKRNSLASQLWRTGLLQLSMAQFW